MFDATGMWYELVDLKFSNGLELKGCKFNGGRYETSEVLSERDLAGGLRRVEITHTETGEVEEYENMWLEYCNVLAEGKGTQFYVRELGYYERQDMQLKANVEYIAMMTGVEL